MNTIESFPELHSEEIDEVINRPPQWIIRWGMSLFFLILLAIVYGSWLLQYPDIISVPFQLSSMNAPRAIVVKNEGRLAELLVKDGQMVKSNQILAYLESTGNPKELLLLEKELQKTQLLINSNNWSSIKSFSSMSFRELGEVQNDFQIFVKELTAMKTYISDGFYIEKQKLFFSDLKSLTAMENNLHEQLELHKRDLELATEEFQVQEYLFKNKVISSLEYKKEKAKLIIREMPIKTTTSAIIQIRTSQTTIEKDLLELNNLVIEHKNSFQQSIQTLLSSIQLWKQRYIIVSPVSGKISFSGPWQDHLYISAGKELLTVEPANGELVGLVKIPQANIGKLSRGQNVLIKLDGFPFREYGIVKGSLSNISITPGKDSVFWGYIALPYKLRSTYNIDLPYTNGLTGKAEIVTADRRFLERLFSVVKTGK